MIWLGAALVYVAALLAVCAWLKHRARDYPVVHRYECRGGPLDGTWIVRTGVSTVTEYCVPAAEGCHLYRLTCDDQGWYLVYVGDGHHHPAPEMTT